MSYAITKAHWDRALATVRRYFPPTPVIGAPRLSAAVGADVSFKLETVTPIRVFKLRGALVKLQALADAGVQGGVVTASAGNHGLAVARAARLHGRAAVICVPAGANPQKVALIQGEGARVVAAGADYQAAYENCLRIGEAEGLTLVHAYDDPDVIAGQGTIGVELLEQGDFDAVVMGIGGGGLIAGVASAVKERNPRVCIVGVEPVGANAMTRSREAGQVTELTQVATFADGLAARRPGDWTFALTQRWVDDLWNVTDPSILDAMAFLLREERQVVEPAGAAAVAGLLRYGAPGKRVAVVLSGANVADAVLTDVLQRLQG